MESDTMYILAAVLILLAVMVSYTSYIFWTICQEKRKTQTLLQRRNAMRRIRSADQYVSYVNLMTWQSNGSLWNSPPPSYVDVDEPPPNYEEVMRFYNPAFQNQQSTLPLAAALLAPSATNKPTEQ